MMRQSKATTALESTGLPVSSTVHSPVAKRSEPFTPVRPAKRSAISAPLSPNVFTQNTPFSTTAGLVWLRRLRHINSVGGASETEHTAVAVAPVLPPGPAVVTTCTAAPSRLMASRKASPATVRTGVGPTTVKAPSMASSGRWSNQLMGYLGYLRAILTAQGRRAPHHPRVSHGCNARIEGTVSPCRRLIRLRHFGSPACKCHHFSFAKYYGRKRQALTTSKIFFAPSLF